ncbi:3081_t:CDS:2, partial [Gigaspora margarita]
LMDKKGVYFKLVETQQIKHTLKAQENINILDSFITSPKDEVTPLFTINDINDHQINHTTCASSHSILDKQKIDVEIGLNHNNHNYTVLELIKKVIIIDRSEFFMLSIGIISSIINGCMWPIFSIIYANVFQVFSKTGDILSHEITFWVLTLLIFSLMVFLVNFIQNVTLGFSSEKLTERIRSMFFSSILRQDISFFDEENHSVG